MIIKENLNVQKTINNTIIFDWSIKFVIINDSKLIIKENQHSSDPLCILDLNSLIPTVQNDSLNETNITIGDEENRNIELEPSENNNSVNNNRIILKLLEKSSTTSWNIEMKSNEFLDQFLKILDESRTSAKLATTTTNTTVINNNKTQSNYYSTNNNGWLDGKSGKYFALAFFIYTAILILLFSLLWVYYASPILHVDEMKTHCIINSNDWGYRSKGVYDLYINVTYIIENGETLTRVMDQYCYGSLCMFTVDDNYKVGDNRTCYYDANDVTFVYFSIAPMVRYRLSITFGLCGSMFGIWLLWVLGYVYNIHKKYFKKSAF